MGAYEQELCIRRDVVGDDAKRSEAHYCKEHITYKTLEERGHRFVRYADDCSIYIRSRKSAHRVMNSISGYLEDKLKLKVNRDNSKLSRPSSSSLLGFSFYPVKQGWSIRIAPTSLISIKQKIKGHTRRNDPTAINKLEPIIRGWVNYFLLQQRRDMQLLDQMNRTRLRMVIWKQWKNTGTRIRNLGKLGIPKTEARK